MRMLLLLQSLPMLALLVLSVLLFGIGVVSGDSLPDSQSKCDSDSEIYSTRHSLPAGWSKGRAADCAAEISFYLAVKQQNLDVLDAKFWSVSNPKSSEYRQYLTVEEINRLVASKPEHITVVNDWLLANGVTNGQIKKFADVFEVRTSVAVAERLFQTKFHQFTHAQWERTVIRAFGAIHVPSAVKSVLDLVMGLHNFPQYNRDRLHKNRTSFATAAVAQSDPNAAIGVIAQTTWQLYNVPSSQVVQNASKITSQGVIEFEEQTFSPEDLQSYAKVVNIPIVALTEDHIVGTNFDPPGVEASLDLQFISTVNQEAMNWFWIEDDTAWLYGFTTHFLNTTIVPQVISISYGWWEGDQCSIGPEECQELGVDDDGYVARVNIDFQKIALRGVTIVASSGDSGAHTRTDEYCTAKTLRAEFPSSSPYVLSVGATQLTSEKILSPQPPICSQAPGITQCAATGTEVAVSYSVAHFTSGGGFSEVAVQPSYQTAAVSQYLNSGVALPPAVMYNASNRATPDVSAVGNNNLILDGNYGGAMSVGGTSAAAPIFAAVIGLLNQASVAKSGQPLGFVNPLLYQIAASTPSAFNDITVGDNKCTEDGCLAVCEGWLAYKGWDPVTGLGTPNYVALLQQVEAL